MAPAPQHERNGMSAWLKLMVVKQSMDAAIRRAKSIEDDEELEKAMAAIITAQKIYCGILFAASLLAIVALVVIFFM